MRAMILLRKKKRSRRKVCSVHKGFKSFDIKNIVFVFLEEIGVSDLLNEWDILSRSVRLLGIPPAITV